MGAKSPAAGGLGTKLSAARGTGVWGRSPQRSKFCIFLQKLLNFRAILIKNNAFKTWHRNRQSNMIQLVALMDYVGSG